MKVRDNAVTNDELKAYWNYSRIFNTIPEKDYEQPKIQQFLMAYDYLRNEFFKHMAEINSAKTVDNKVEV